MAEGAPLKTKLELDPTSFEAGIKRAQSSQRGFEQSMSRAKQGLGAFRQTISQAAGQMGGPFAEASQSLSGFLGLLKSSPQIAVLAAITAALVRVKNAAVEAQDKIRAAILESLPGDRSAGAAARGASGALTGARQEAVALIQNSSGGDPVAEQERRVREAFDRRQSAQRIASGAQYSPAAQTGLNAAGMDPVNRQVLEDAKRANEEWERQANILKELRDIRRETAKEDAKQSSERVRDAEREADAIDRQMIEANKAADQRDQEDAKQLRDLRERATKRGELRQSADAEVSAIEASTRAAPTIRSGTDALTRAGGGRGANVMGLRVAERQIRIAERTQEIMSKLQTDVARLVKTVEVE